MEPPKQNSVVFLPVHITWLKCNPFSEYLVFLGCPACWEQSLLQVCGDLPSLSPHWGGTEVKIANLLPGGASGKEPLCQRRRHKRRGSIPGLGRSPGEGNGNPLQ